ncbi:hypothetical protein Tco_0915198, partial [Tanacetum coccineum]
NESALVCLNPLEDDDNEKEKQEVKNLAEPTAKRQTRITPCLKNFRVIQKESIFHSNKTPQVSSVFAITSTLPTIEPKDFLIMGDEHLSTFRVEEIVPIPRESENSSGSNSENILPSCDDFSSINEDIECKDSYDSNLDESTFLVTRLSDKAECFNPGGDNDEIDAFLAIKVSTCIEEGYYESEGDVFYLESLLSDDTTHNLSLEVFFDHEPQHFKNESDHDTFITFSPKSDPLHHEFTGELITTTPRIVREHEDYISRMWLLCGNSSSQSPKNFHTINESFPTSTTLIEDSDSNREEIDIFSGPDNSIPPGFESNFDSEVDIINNLL